MLKSGSGHGSPDKVSSDCTKPVVWRKANPKRLLDGQTELNRCIRELRAASAFSAGSGKLENGFIQADGQGITSFERCVVLLPVGGAVARLGLRD